MASVTYDHVTKRFGDVVAVNDLDIEVEDKEFLVLVGPSGCGKTTERPGYCHGLSILRALPAHVSIRQHGFWSQTSKDG